MYFKIENSQGNRIQEFFINGKRLQMDETYLAAYVTSQGVPNKYGRNRKHDNLHAVDALKNYLKVLGVKDISRFLSGAMEGQIILTPQEEVDRIINGFEVNVLPNSDHEGFIALAQSTIQQADTIGLNRDAILLLNGQMAKHQEMIVAMQQMQAQQNNLDQQMANSRLLPPVE